MLRKAFVKARIQRVTTPAGTKIPENHDASLGPIETWQVWCGVNSKDGVVEVTAPREMLPFAVVREAYRCRLYMDVTIESIKGGVRMSAKPIPPPPKAVSAEAVAIAADHSADPEAVQAALDSGSLK